MSAQPFGYRGFLIMIDDPNPATIWQEAVLTDAPRIRFGEAIDLVAACDLIDLRYPLPA